MPVVHCYFCDQTYSVPDAARGKQVACRNCFRKLDVPLVAAPPPVPTVSEIPDLKPSDSAEVKAAKAARKIPAKPPVKPVVVREPTMDAVQPKSAAPVAKVVAPQKPKAVPSPAESDRWDFDAGQYGSEAIDPEEFEPVRTPVRKKRSRPERRWRFRKERTAPAGEFAPFDGLEGWAFMFNVAAAAVLLPMSRSNPDGTIVAFLIVLVATVLFSFVDACLSGGIVRVLFLFIIPILIGLLPQPDFRPVQLGYKVMIAPYTLYVFCIRLRYVWPVDFLFTIASIACAIGISIKYPAAWGKMVDDIRRSVGW